MADKEKKIMENCRKLLARLSEEEKERFLTFIEAWAFLTDRRMTART